MILICACAYSDIIPDSRKAAVIARLRDGQEEVRVVTDLCGLAARRDALLSEAAASERLQIAACHPRAIRSLFAWAGAPLDPGRVTFINLREEPDTTAEMGACSELPTVDRAAEWIPWFPVIDTSRCISCRQCFDFCLFGVYEKRDDGTVRVVHPENCKTNCPACARLCPEAALMFPKYGEPPINGAEVTDETAVRASARALAEGDLRAALEERKKRRRALLKPEYPTDDGNPHA